MRCDDAGSLEFACLRGGRNGRIAVVDGVEKLLVGARGRLMLRLSRGRRYVFLFCGGELAPLIDWTKTCSKGWTNERYVD